MSELQEAKVAAEEERGEMYSNLGCAGIILALCLGLGSCGLMSSISDRYEAEAKLIKKQAEVLK